MNSLFTCILIIMERFKKNKMFIRFTEIGFVQNILNFR